MPVVCQHLGEPFTAHRLHRDAIDQTVPLIWPGPVELQPGQKRLPALRHDQDIRIFEERARYAARFVPKSRPGTGKERQVLAQHFICGDDSVGCQRAAELYSEFMGRVVDTRQGRPVESVGKNRSQCALLGVP